jgi:hypothetical protein
LRSAGAARLAVDPTLRVGPSPGGSRHYRGGKYMGQQGVTLLKT